MADTKISGLTLTTLFEGDDSLPVAEVDNTTNKKWLIKGIGGFTRRTITGADTLVASDRGKIVDATSGTFTLSVTAAATVKDGWWCVVKNSGTGVVTIDPNASETIDGITTLVIGPGAQLLVMCDGSNFFTIRFEQPNPRTKRVATQDDSTSVTLAKSTDLDMPLEPGSYAFKYTLRCRSSDAGTGFAFNVNFSGTQTALNYWWQWCDLSSTAATGATQQSDSTVGQVRGMYASRIARTTAAFGVTISVDTANADTLIIVEGIVEVTVAGNLELYFGSEAAVGTQSIMVGSGVSVTRLN